MANFNPTTVLLARAGHATTAAERHHRALYAVEAGLKLGAAARVALWTERGEPGAETVRPVLGKLTRASLGTWLELLRSLDHELTTEPNHPVLRHDLTAKLTDEKWTALAAAIVEAGVLSKQAARCKTPLDALGLAVAYRNAVVGHGSWRELSFYERMGDLWLAVAQSLAASGVLDGAQIVDDSGALGGQSLAPLVVARTHPILEVPQIGFLNRVVVRGGQVRRMDFLDYGSGEIFEHESPAPEWLTTSPLDETGGVDVGDFEILEELGQGATATVHLAVQRSLGRRVALKVLSAELLQDPVAKARFQREVRALSRIAHPNVVQLLSAGVRDKGPYYAMTWVDGRDLSQVVVALPQAGSSGLTEAHLAAAVGADSSGPKSLARVASERFAEVADGLAALHAEGIVHRDVKPSNLLLTRDAQRVILVDLGLAQLSDATGDLTAQDIRVLGTLRYMAPEQLQRNLLEVDGRADVYGLCAALYHLVTGRPPHDGDTEVRLIQQVLYEPPPPANAPRDLAVILAKGLSKRPEDRYADATALAEDLRAFADGKPIAARPPGVLAKGRRWLTAHPAVVGSVLTVGLLAIAAGAWQWDRTRVKVGWYSKITVRHGAWIGVGDLPDGASPHTSFRVETVGSRVRRISWTQGQMTPGPFLLNSDMPEANALVQEYDDVGQVHVIHAEDLWGTLHWRAQVTHEDDTATWRYLAASGLPKLGPTPAVTPNASLGAMLESGVNGLSWTLNADGWPLEVRFHNTRGGPMRDGHQVAGHRYVNDGQGRPVERTSLDHEGNPISGKYADQRVQMAYEDPGNPWLVTTATWFDADGPARQRDLGAVTTFEHDDYGRRIRLSGVDVDGEPALIRKPMRNTGHTPHVFRVAPLDRCYALVWDYRADGRMLAWRCEDTAGAPMASGSGHAAVRHTWGTASCPERVEYVDPDGELLNVRGEAYRQLTCNPGQRLTHSDAFDEHGAPVDEVRGRRRFAHDDAGRIEKIWDLGPDGEFLIGLEGEERLVKTYFEDGELRSIRYELANGDLVIGSRGYAVQESIRDELGRPAGIRFFDAEGKPRLRPPERHREPHIGDCRKPAAIQKRLDEHGRVVSHTLLDAENRPYVGHVGYSTYEVAYSEDGREARYSFLDEARRPVVNEDGCHGVLQMLNAAGDDIENRCLDAEGRPANDHDGVARTTWSRDAHGRVLGDAAFDTAGTPVIGIDGYHRKQLEYSGAGALKSAAAYDVEGNPTAMTSDIWKVTYGLDADGTRIQNLSFDHLSGETSIVDLHTDWRGQILEATATGTIGSYLAPFRSVKYVREPSGALIEIVADDRVRLLLKRDSGGRLEQIRQVGTDGEPVTAVLPCELSIEAHPTHERPFAVLCTPLVDIADLAPTHRMDLRWSPHGLASWSAFGADGEPIPVLGQAHRLDREYNHRGQVTTESHYGVHGQSVPGPSGGFRVVQIYDDLGRLTETSLRDGNGGLVAGTMGVAKRTVALDEMGNMLEVAQYGADDAPVQSGLVRTTMTWDRAGRELSRHLEFADGVVRKLAFTWNANGTIEVIADDPSDDGHATRITVDRHGKATAFDDQGNPLPLNRRILAQLPKSSARASELRGDLKAAYRRAP